MNREEVCSVKKVYFLLLVLLLLALCACGEKPDDVMVPLSGEEFYSAEEVDQAAEAVKKYFAENFPGCTMTGIYYNPLVDEEVIREHLETEYHADSVISLSCDFKTGRFGVREDLTRHVTYGGWDWVLTRNGDGAWEVADQAFGVDELKGFQPVQNQGTWPEGE